MNFFKKYFLFLSLCQLSRKDVDCGRTLKRVQNNLFSFIFIFDKCLGVFILFFNYIKYHANLLSEALCEIHTFLWIPHKIMTSSSL